MKKRKALIFSIIAVTVFTFFSCKKKENIKDVVDDSNYEYWFGNWKLVSYEDFSTDTRTLKDLANSVNNGDVEVSFRDSADVGKLKGHSLLNPIQTTYQYSDYRTVKIGVLPDTLLAEPPWGQLFIDNISKAERYVVNGKNLRIFYNSNKNSITFERE